MSLTTLDPAAKRSPYGTIGGAIKHFRKKLKLSQSKLASNIGVSQPAIAHYESGHRIPPVKVIQKLAEELHCPIQLLVSHRTNIF